MQYLLHCMSASGIGIERNGLHLLVATELLEGAEMSGCIPEFDTKPIGLRWSVLGQDCRVAEFSGCIYMPFDTWIPHHDTAGYQVYAAVQQVSLHMHQPITILSQIPNTKYGFGLLQNLKRTTYEGLAANTSTQHMKDQLLQVKTLKGSVYWSPLQRIIYFPSNIRVINSLN